MAESNPRWEKIVALDDAALNLAVETHCYGRAWQPIARPIGAWTCNGVPANNPPPPHTASWALCMALVWANGMQVCAPASHGVKSGTVDVLALDGIWELGCVSEAQARRAICQLAVYASHKAVT